MLGARFIGRHHVSIDVRTPRVGMLATVRNRRGMVASVDPFDTTEGRLHLVRVEYTDRDGQDSDTVVWEREHASTLLEPNALPLVASEPPMVPAEFDALVRAARWSALTPYLDPRDATRRMDTPVSAPFFGAVQVDDFQLVPVLRAMQMPRVSLLLADDVGLGKTIEAGMILTELLQRRRVRRVLVITPASLRLQWLLEMQEKFSLSFDHVDRQETYALQKRLGLDANPWRSFQRIVTSYHYLRQPDVLGQFLATCRAGAGKDGPDTRQANLPWDLLIVDEAHNLMPANFGEESDLTDMLRAITPYFEHKLFLTATPHNGYTRSFSGLLELLDPVRFTQTNEFSDDERRRVEDVVVRRLKSEISALDDAAGRPRRFGDRHLEPLPLYFLQKEQALSRAFAAFRTAVKSFIASRAKRNEQIAGSFAIEILNKRLLSGPWTFADSWTRFTSGLRDPEPVHGADTDSTDDTSAVTAAKRSADEDIDDDGERETRQRVASRVVGAWMRPFVIALQTQVTGIDDALRDLGLGSTTDMAVVPTEDARFKRLVDLVKRKLRSGTSWRADERLIVFTEYKTTLDYLVVRLRQEFRDHGSAVHELYGGMGAPDRERIKDAFNDPANSVRILVATDAASEGLNLQETARFIVHYEIPWNPSRLEQRNGRLDRHGQARDVTVHHFTSDDDADIAFIGKVVAKLHEIREDLGSVGELFDGAFQRRFLDGDASDAIINGLDREIAVRRGATVIPRIATTTTGTSEAEGVKALCNEIDLDEEALVETLRAALGIGSRQPRLSGPDGNGRMQLVRPVPPAWEGVVDETVRRPGRGSLGALPALVFDPKHFVRENGGRPVFRPSRDAVLLHLGHPVFRQAVQTFARARFPGGLPGHAASRWTVRRGSVPPGADALVVLTVEELATNGLREPFHHWIRSFRFPVSAGRIGAALGHVAPLDDRQPSATITEADIVVARAIWDEVDIDVRDRIADIASARTTAVTAGLATELQRARQAERERFTDRIHQVERAMQDTTIARLERERDGLVAKGRQLDMFRTELETRRLAEQVRELGLEVERRRFRHAELLAMLRTERERVLARMLPSRHALAGAVQVFPVAIEIRLPGARS